LNRDPGLVTTFGNQRQVPSEGSFGDDQRDVIVLFVRAKATDIAND